MIDAINLFMYVSAAGFWALVIQAAVNVARSGRRGPDDPVGTKENVSAVIKKEHNTSKGRG